MSPGPSQRTFGVSTATIYRWAQKGHIRIHKRAGCSFLNVEEVKNFLLGKDELDE
ncbi:hypothetical protein Q669_00545 [Labrenzia sp. C1B10]|nr:hypothetical protein Q669_00545 [Labrenzia sp. C1B10]